MVATSYFVAGASRSSRRSCAIAASAAGVGKKMLLRNRPCIAPPSPKPAAAPETLCAWKAEGGKAVGGKAVSGKAEGGKAEGRKPASSGAGGISAGGESDGGAERVPAPNPRRSRTRPEALVRDALAASIPGARTEIACSSGFVDVVTPDEIIEVKRAQLWKGGLGQVLVYSKDFPGLKPRLHLFGPRSYEHFALAHTACDMFGVSVTTEEGHSRPSPSATVPGAAGCSGAAGSPIAPGDAGAAIAPGAPIAPGAAECSGAAGAAIVPGAPTFPGASKGPGAAGAPTVPGAPVASGRTPRAPDRRSWRAWGSLCLGYVCGRSA